MCFCSFKHGRKPDNGALSDRDSDRDSPTAEALTTILDTSTFLKRT